MFGQGARANATIGRAVQLAFRNIGGDIAGETDMATHGQAGKFADLQLSTFATQSPRKLTWIGARGMSVMPKADINDIPFANKARCVGGMTAVPKTTDYDTIAERFDQPAVFSTHHPVHDQVSILDPGYLSAELIEEEWGWLGEKMRYYRRSLRDLTDPLAGARFVIERICESTPTEELKLKDPKG